MTTPELGSNAGFLAKPSKAKRRKADSRALVVIHPPKPKAKKKSNPFSRGLNKLKRAVLFGAGSLFVLTGILIAPLPGPLGLPISIFGLILVLRNSYWAKRTFVKVKKKHPNWIMPVRKLLRPKPKVASIFWQQFLRTERLVFSREGRILKAFRRKFLRKVRK